MYSKCHQYRNAGTVIEGMSSGSFQMKYFISERQNQFSIFEKEKSLRDHIINVRRKRIQTYHCDRRVTLTLKEDT